MVSEAVLAILVCCAHLVTSQEPQKCVSPLTLQGQERSLDLERRFEREAIWVYDVSKEAVAWYETTELNSTGSAYHDIWLWKERVWYRFDIRKSQCTRHELTLPFAKLEIPPDAQFVESIYIGQSGVPGEGLLANVWLAHGEDVFSTYHSEMIYTEVDCLAVQVTKFRPTSVEHSVFSDLSTTITRPDLFIPPEECQHLSGERKVT
eukprot:m.8062 g.8062  ORF g.8062 m.8062 type:complete len:206 (+) comp20300_c0_seq2:128-745(+)